MVSSHQEENYDLMEVDTTTMDVVPAAMICGKGLAIAASIWVNDIFVVVLEWLLGNRRSRSCVCGS